MAKAMPDITGQRFGSLVAVEFSGRLPQGNAATLVWRCVCDCGGEKIVSRPDLLAGRVASCGCLRDLGTHRKTKAPGYCSYRAMIARCTNPKAKDFPRYGGAGIRVCARWLAGDGGLTGVECFLEDMGERPSPRYSLDRFPNGNGNYEPSNCRWATREEQARNTRRNYFAPSDDPRDICAAHGVQYSTFRQRMAKGWSLHEALNGREKPRPRGRAYGRNNPSCKLSNEDVIAIRQAPRGYGSGVTLARRYGVRPETISAIRNGRVRGRP